MSFWQIKEKEYYAVNKKKWILYTDMEELQNILLS